MSQTLKCFTAVFVHWRWRTSGTKQTHSLTHLFYSISQLSFGTLMHFAEILDTWALLAMAGKDIVFRFIIEYSSLRYFGPCIIVGLFLYDDFWKMIFWLVLKLISYYRVITSWRILVSFRGFFWRLCFAWWNIWVLHTSSSFALRYFLMWMARPPLFFWSILLWNCALCMRLRVYWSVLCGYLNSLRNCWFQLFKCFRIDEPLVSVIWNSKNRNQRTTTGPSYFKKPQQTDEGLLVLWVVIWLQCFENRGYEPW
jgi:hypothetical protein